MYIQLHVHLNEFLIGHIVVCYILGKVFGEKYNYKFNTIYT